MRLPSTDQQRSALQHLGLIGILQVVRQLDERGQFSQRRPVNRHDLDLGHGIAHFNAQHAVLDLAGNLQADFAGIHHAFEFGPSRQLAGDTARFPKGAVLDVAGNGKGLAVGNDQFPRQPFQADKGVTRNVGGGTEPAQEGVPTGLREGEREGQPANDHGPRSEREFLRRTGADASAKIILTRFIRDLMNGGMIEGGGKIGQMALFLGQFDNAEQTVAQAAIFFLDEIGQVLEAAAMPKPASRPVAKRGEDDGQTQEREDKAHARRRIPEAIGNKKGQQGNNKAGHDRAKCDGGLDAPEAALDIGELAAQLLRERHRKVIIILGHATKYNWFNMPVTGGGVQIKTRGAQEE